jgi:hypothetical protein
MAWQSRFSNIPQPELTIDFNFQKKEKQKKMTYFINKVQNELYLLDFFYCPDY